MRMVFYLLDLNYDEIQKEEFFESKNIKMIKVKGDPCNNEVKEVCYTFSFSNSQLLTSFRFESWQLAHKANLSLLLRHPWKLHLDYHVDYLNIQRTRFLKHLIDKDMIMWVKRRGLLKERRRGSLVMENWEMWNTLKSWEYCKNKKKNAKPTRKRKE